MSTVRRALVTIASAAILIGIPVTAAAQDYPPPQDQPEVLPTTIERAPSDDQPEGVSGDQQEPGVAPESQAADLAQTGIDAWVYLVIGAAAVAAGSGVVIYGRRRTAG